ncbi:hypothetical protein LR004_02865, partial [Candidatus Gracilibacteria bacterium]|nr:hypothetical protein [Candidatus Gracilibacteria bacterium]
SKEWAQWSDRQIVDFQLFQKRLAVPFDKFHSALEKVLDRPVFTHEFGMNYDGIVSEYLGESNPPSLEDILNLIPEKKRILILT